MIYVNDVVSKKPELAGLVLSYFDVQNPKVQHT